VPALLRSGIREIVSGTHERRLGISRAELSSNECDLWRRGLEMSDEGTECEREAEADRKGEKREAETD
jgi:hypothetical protein